MITRYINNKLYSSCCRSFISEIFCVYAYVLSCFSETRPPIKYVLDVTIAYPNGIPLSLATLGFGTREKCDIAVHYQIFRADEVPFDNEEKLRDWMYGVYEEKDKMLAQYYETGEFVAGERGKRVVFSWGKITTQYVFWFASFYAQYQVCSFLRNMSTKTRIHLFLDRQAGLHNFGNSFHVNDIQFLGEAFLHSYFLVGPVRQVGGAQVVLYSVFC
ncbi:unnamed protein product [Angiostrongylus costaricensis]|uniref:Acyltransf_C domain-containing protein n=1 Tax=Angiostrongylus costaricensis TaxID=334426 RepID=A0A0R3PM65_ANGCS|nr:unnamed protein product [Angiostrongylus costaricensis]